MKNCVQSVKALEILDSRGVPEKSRNAEIIRPNRIGTVSETIATIHLCRKAGWGMVIALRTGETKDELNIKLALNREADVQAFFE